MTGPTAAAARARPVRIRVGPWIAAIGLALPAGAETLRVGAASSLREVVEAGARGFESERPAVQVTVAYGASSALATQLRAGAPLDVLLSADAELAVELARDGVSLAPRALARNRLVVLTRAQLAPLSSPEELAGPAVRRVAVPHAAVPAGRYARRWLAGRGLLDALRTRLVATEHARATLVAVDQGFADAAIVYATDARLARRARLAFEIPEDEQPAIVYAAAVTRDAREPGLAKAFVDRLIQGPGRDDLLRAGFAPGVPP